MPPPRSPADGFRLGRSSAPRGSYTVGCSGSSAVAAHCAALIAAAGPACVAVKLQLACFERLGGPGWEAARRTVADARDAGLLDDAGGIPIPPSEGVFINPSRQGGGVTPGVGRSTNGS